MLQFWQWARSDLLGNTDRGVLAEWDSDPNSLRAVRAMAPASESP